MNDDLLPGTEEAASLTADAAAPSDEARKEVRTIADLKRAEYNPRSISDWGLEQLRKMMMKFGDLSGITVNVRTGNLVGGHQRTKIFDKAWKVTKQNIIKDEVGTVAEGYIETPFGRWTYREVDWDLPTEMAANIAANKGGGKWDFDKLKKVSRAIKDSDDQMIMFTGLDATEQSNLGLGAAVTEAGTISAKDKMDRFLKAEIKQIVLYFGSEEYNQVLMRMQNVMKKEKLEDNTTVLLHLLGYYEKDRA